MASGGESAGTGKKKKGARVKDYENFKGYYMWTWNNDITTLTVEQVLKTFNDVVRKKQRG